MDPSLRELIAEGRADDDVAVIVRFHPKADRIPRGMRIVARFGTVATARAPRGALERLHADPVIASLKAPKAYAAELHTVHDWGEADEPRPGDQMRPSGLAETGRGTVVCVLDWSIDFVHPDFRNPDGTTRFLAIWDQRPRTGDVTPYGYGRVHDRAAINRALAGPDPFGTLHYTPAAAAHGTHVLGIAAGNGRAGGPSGIAPGAELIFVHLSDGGGDDLGSSIELLEGIDFAVRTAGDRPLVFNMSLGRHAGPHDGTLLIERAIDALLIERPGTAVAQSAGNYFSRRVHMSGRLSEGRRARLPIERTRMDGQPLQVDVWYNGADVFDAGVTGPSGAAATAPLGRHATVRAGAAEMGRLYHRQTDPNNGDNLISLVLRKDAPAGEWVVEVEGVDVVDGRWHAWIERDAACPACQAQFPADHVATATTTGSICNAMRTIAVGAFDAHDPAHPIPPFSSAGPTRDGRRKPLLSAPGVRVLAPRSRDEASAEPGYVRMSGTSMAAPQVAGTLALMMEAAGRQRVSTLRRTMFTALERAEGDEDRRGYGLLDVRAAVERARALRRPAEIESPPAVAPPVFREPQAGDPADPPPPAALALRMALDPADPSLAVVGWPGQRPLDPPRRGDLVVRQGIGAAPSLMQVADPALLDARALAVRAVLAEHGLPGRFVRIADDDGLPGMGRRLLGPDGLIVADTYLLRRAERGEALVPSARRTLRLSARGPDVAEAQTLLNRADARRAAAGESRITSCPLAVDGVFGSRTRAAVLSFQRAAFIEQPREWDAVIGPKTWGMLDLLARDEPPPEPPKPNGGGNLIIPFASGVYPVIVLPGVMGTRLCFPSGSGMPRWDPDDKTGMRAWFSLDPGVKLRGLDMRAPAEVLKDGSNPDEHRRGWDQLVQGVYRVLLVAIEQAYNTPPNFPQLGLPQLRCPVWAMGYDWRQRNPSHIQALDAFVEKVLESETGAQQVILVTHSMGGLVARAALADADRTGAGARLGRRIRGVIHAVQPAVGAVVAARRFRTGFTREVDGGLGEALLAIEGGAIEATDTAASADDGEGGLGKFAQTMLLQALFSDRRLSANPIYYNRLMAVLGGANELLPSDAGGRGWWPPSRKRTEPLFDLYGMPGGLIHPALAGDPARTELLARFAEAGRAHAAIEGKYHPVTGVLFSTGLTTDVGLDPEQRQREGDGTVPAFSGRCPDLAAAHFRHGFDRVEHAACFGDGAFREAVLNGIAYIAGNGPALGERPPPQRIFATGGVH